MLYSYLCMVSIGKSWDPLLELSRRTIIHFSLGHLNTLVTCPDWSPFRTDELKPVWIWTGKLKSICLNWYSNKRCVAKHKLTKFIPEWQFYDTYWSIPIQCLTRIDVYFKKPEVVITIIILINEKYNSHVCSSFHPSSINERARANNRKTIQKSK